MSKRSEEEISRAIRRLSREEQVPLAELAGKDLTINGVVVRPSARVFLRWGQQGKAGCFLDILFECRGARWVTSRAALERFAAELRAKVRLRAG